MQAVKLRLYGKYWDSYVYDDNLLLISLDGAMELYSWDRVVDCAMASDEDLSPVVRHIATRGKAWYGKAVQELLANPVVGQTMRRLVDKASAQRLTLNRRELQAVMVRAVEVEMFPTTDLECYANTLFIGSTDGLAACSLGSRDRLDASRRARIYDGPSLRLAAGYRRLAIAQGSDGLAETSAQNLDEYSYMMGEWDCIEPRQISTRRCDMCSWAAFDIIATEFGQGGYVGAFEKPE